MTPKNVKQVVDSIFNYDNYRIFLKDYFDAKKKEKTSFSQRYFAKKAGFNAHNFCTLVLEGKRNLATESIHKIIMGIGLKIKAASYFENLVYLNQATTIADKELYFQRLKKISNKTQFYQLHKDQFFFYEKWYYPVIRELMTLMKWNGDYSVLAQSVRPPISTSEAKHAAELLLITNMVIKYENGGYALSNEFVTSAGVPEFIKIKARRDVLLKGIETIDTIATHEKYVSYSTVTMNKALYEEVREILDEARQKILSLVKNNSSADEIYEVVFQVFPVSNMAGNKKNQAGKNTHAL